MRVACSLCLHTHTHPRTHPLCVCTLLNMAEFYTSLFNGIYHGHKEFSLTTIVSDCPSNFNFVCRMIEHLPLASLSLSICVCLHFYFSFFKNQSLINKTQSFSLDTILQHSHTREYILYGQRTTCLHMRDSICDKWFTLQFHNIVTASE